MAPLHRFQLRAALFSLTAREAISGVALTASGAEFDGGIARFVVELRSLWRKAREIGSAAVIQQTLIDLSEPLFGGHDRGSRGAGYGSRPDERSGVRGGGARRRAHSGCRARVERDGVDAWFDVGRWLQGKLEIAPQAALLYGDLAARFLAARRGLSKKCLVGTGIWPRPAAKSTARPHRVFPPSGPAWFLLAWPRLPVMGDPLAHSGLAGVLRLVAPINILIIGPSIIVNYLIASFLLRLSEKGDQCSLSRTVLIVGILFNVAFLGFFKYADFAYGAINDVFGGQPHSVARHSAPRHLVHHLPEDRLPDRRPGRTRQGAFTFREYCTLVLFFGSSSSGQDHYREMMPQFAAATCRFDKENFAVGLMLLFFGLSRKRSSPTATRR